MELIFEILLTAVGSAILFNLDASTGGTDIVAMIIKKYSSLNIGTALLVSDAVIAASTIFIFDIETFLFCMLGLMMKGYVADTVIDGMNLCKHFLSSPQSPAKYLIS